MTSARSDANLSVKNEPYTASSSAIFRQPLLHLKNKYCQDHYSLAPHVGFVDFISTKITETKSNSLVIDRQNSDFLLISLKPTTCNWLVYRAPVSISERIAHSWLPSSCSFQSLNVSIAPGPGVDRQQLLSVNVGTGASQIAIFSAIR
jgi:hypothetical protein